MRSARPTALLPAAIVVATTLLTACSGFFKITQQNGGAPAASDGATPSLPSPTTGNVAAVDTFDTEPVPQASDSAGIERLVELATLWTTIAQFDPWIITRGIPLDSALVRAVPRVRAARNVEEMSEAIQHFVAVVDPRPTQEASRESAAPRTLSAVATADSVFIISAPTDVFADGNPAAVAELRAIAQRASNYPSVVVDIRANSIPGNPNALRLLHAAFDSSELAAFLTTDTIAMPEVRRRVLGPMYVDTLPDRIVIGGAPSAFQTTQSMQRIAGKAPVLTTPAPRQRGRNRTPLPPLVRPRRIVIVANAATVWPMSIAALLANDRAALFGEGAVNDVRTAQLVSQQGKPAIAVDSQFAPSLASDSTAPSVRAALASIRAGHIPQRAHRAHTIATLPAAFDTAAYPPMGARVLGVFRLWAAMRTLHAHRDAYDDELADVFRAAIARAEAARNAAEYARALQLLAASGDDSGMRLSGAAFEQAAGEFALPIRLRWIEGRPVIVQVANDSAARASGLAVGDEITSIEGFPITAWVADHRRDVLASNDWTRLDALMEQMRRGPRGSALLRVRDARGIERAVELPRTLRFHDSTAFLRVEQPFTNTVLDGIRVINATVSGDPSTAVLTGSRGVLVDLRGKITDAGYAAVKPLFPATRQPIVRVVRRGASEPCAVESIRAAQSQCVDERSSRAVFAGGEPNNANYSGLIAVLVDERTDSRGELLALTLEAAGARILGTETAGALADASWLQLPGGLAVVMPLEEVRRADGGQLHRVGITPLVEFRPAIRAVRNGSDYVYDRAIQWMRGELSPPERRRR